MPLHELIDGIPDGFLAPPVRTTGPLITWRQFWAKLQEAREYDIDTVHIHVTNWLLEKMAFGNQGVRMVER